jgi:hypothetical protein
LVVVVVEAAAAAADAMHGVHRATTVVSTESISIPLLYPSIRHPHARLSSILLFGDE